MVRKGRGALVRAAVTAAAAGARMALGRKKNVASRGGRKVIRRRGGTRIVTSRRRRKVRTQKSMEQGFTGLRTRARPMSLQRLVWSGLERRYLRVQGLSQFDTSTGFYALANRRANDGTLGFPVHVWDITSQPNVVGGVISNPVVGFLLGMVSSAAGADCITRTLPSNDATGAAVTVNAWTPENVRTSLEPDMPMRKSIHQWSHIKLNLYGVRARATRFVVDLIMVREEFADFIDGANSNSDKKKLFAYLAWPFVFNNLNQGDVAQSAKYIKRLKSYEVILDPIQTVDYNGTTSVPRMQTVNWFVNHNRVRHYDHSSGDGVPAAWVTGPVTDTEQGNQINNRVDAKYRVYLMLRAMSPAQRVLGAGETLAATAPDAISEPSYDLLIRNKFVDPK